MFFKNRTDAGEKLAQALKKYKDKEVVVYALPRGGVVVAVEIAKFLKAPLDLIISRKIGHPFQPEYAIAAVTEDGDVIGNDMEIRSVDKKWFKEEVERQKLEAKRRREQYLTGRKKIAAKDKIAILVDDGIATGLTIRAGILELKHQKSEKIVIATPVVSRSIADIIRKEADEIIALEIPEDHDFLFAVGSYYNSFNNISDKEVISIIGTYDKEFYNLKKS